MITIKQFVFNPFMENTFVLYDETKECIIIDPGCYEKEEEEQLKNFILENELTVKKLLNTHCHIDHVLGNDFIKKAFDVPLTIHPKDVPTLKSNEIVAPIYGFGNYKPSTADEFVEDGETILFGNSSLEVVFVPGHSPGHIALFDADQKTCIGGDVLFKGSIGRTDLPGGDYDILLKSIKDRLFTLGDKVIVYPGHGSSTTIQDEKESNPFCGNHVQN